MIQQEEAIFNTSVPDPGLLVEVRRRHWTVKDVDDREHGRDQKGQTLVTLESIDEDSLGEELQVLWQIEPGARVVPRVGLPKIDGYDRNEDLEAYLNAVRWGAIANAEQRASLQAPFRSGITIEDYQLDPLVRALDMSHVSLLIADDVGLGKTIEAGLVVQELLLRCRARTVFVVCPASLQIKWQEEMLSKFGLKFEIVDTEYLRKLRRERGLNVNPWTSYPRLITSMDWIKTGEGLRFLKETLPAQQTYPRKFDILVVDEAHNVAPAGYAADYSAKPSLRTQVIQRMTPHFTHKLFLSATPHNGYQASFTSLLELLDDQRFSRSIMPTEKQLQPVLVRRLKSDLYDEDHKPFFPSRELKALEIDYTPEEREICRKLRDFTDSLLENAQDSATRVSVKFVGSLLKKRLFSSSAAFANTLEKYRATLLAGPKKKRTKPDEGRLLRAVRRAEEDVREETEREEATEEALELTSQAAPSLDDDRLALLNDLCKRARQIAKRGDSKEQAIVDWLNRYLRINGKWNDERVVLFTEYLDTFKALYNRLVQEGFSREKSADGKTRIRLMTITGSSDKDERERVKAAFQANPRKTDVRILLATDAASEGIDLQNYCRYMIHVEIPWNPNVMEQRNGRIDRHGQRASTVQIWHPVGRGFQQTASAARLGDLEGDQEYLMRVALKVNAIRADIGSVGAVIEDGIQSAMLNRVPANLNSPETEARAQKTRVVKAEKELQEKIVKLHQRLVDSREELRLSPENVASAVNVAMKLAENPPIEPFPLESVERGSAFRVPNLRGSWAATLNELSDPIDPTRRRPITFDPDVARECEDVVLQHLNSPLVRKSLRLLREELWSQEDVKRLRRVAFRVKKGIETPVALLFSRLVLTGGDARRLHEEILISGGELRDDFTHKRVETLAALNELYSKSAPFDDVSDALLSDMRTRFDKCQNAILQSIDVRAKEVVRQINGRLYDMKKREIDNITELLDDLKKNIENELQNGESKMKQLFFDVFEKEEQFEQIKRDRRALESRLNRIPIEKEEEIAAIERRFEKITDRAFPAAVVFVVPENLVGKEGN